VLTDSSLADIAEFKNKDVKDLNVIYPLKESAGEFGARNPFFKFQPVVKETAATAQQAAAMPAAVVVDPGPQFTYKGNMVMNNKLIGIIEDNWQKDVCFVQAGDTCSGYKVSSVEDKKAVLSKDGQEIILMKGAENE
jgi:hypothetical protein